MALMTPIAPSLTGTLVTYGAVNSSDTFPNDGKTLLRVKNGSGASITVTFTDVGSVAPSGATSFNGNVVGTVAAGAERSFGPFAPSRFNNANGNVTVGYSATASVTAVAEAMPNPS